LLKSIIDFNPQLLARYLKMRSPLLRRYSRVLAAQELKKKILDLHGYGLALEGLAATHNSNENIGK
jgi:hypothetical protein